MVRAMTSKRPTYLKPMRLCPFGWFGGKTIHIPFILQHLPLDANHFCDVYGGSASVILNVPHYPIQTYNDLNSEVVNFFTVLRDHPTEMDRLISLTPLSREELMKACLPNPTACPLERARLFYVRARQTRSGMSQNRLAGSWGYSLKNHGRLTNVSINRWLKNILSGDLLEIARRLLLVQIENRPALEVLRMYDAEDIIFYLDPPYVHSSRGHTRVYKHEMSNQDHEELAEVCCQLKGRVLLSGYKSDLYARIFKEWYRVDDRPRWAPAAQGLRQESLWMNFTPLSQMELFENGRT